MIKACFDIFLKKYFPANFSVNGTARIKSEWQLYPYTSKHSFLPLLILGCVSRFWKLDKKKKKLLRNRELVEGGGGSLRKGGLQVASSVFLKKSMFSFLLELLSGKYSHLLLSIDLFFQVVYFLLENDIWILLFSYSYF